MCLHNVHKSDWRTRHSSAGVLLPKACWWDLIKVETAVQVKAGFKWSFLIHGTRSQNVFPNGYTTCPSSMLGPVNRLALWREHILQVDKNPTNDREPPLRSDVLLFSLLTIWLNLPYSLLMVLDWFCWFAWSLHPKWRLLNRTHHQATGILKSISADWRVGQAATVHVFHISNV